MAGKNLESKRQEEAAKRARKAMAGFTGAVTEAAESLDKNLQLGPLHKRIEKLEAETEDLASSFKGTAKEVKGLASAAKSLSKYLTVGDLKQATKNTEEIATFLSTMDKNRQVENKVSGDMMNKMLDKIEELVSLYENQRDSSGSRGDGDGGDSFRGDESNIGDTIQKILDAQKQFNDYVQSINTALNLEDGYVQVSLLGIDDLPSMFDTLNEKLSTIMSAVSGIEDAASSGGWSSRGEESEKDTKKDDAKDAVKGAVKDIAGGGDPKDAGIKALESMEKSGTKARADKNLAAAGRGASVVHIDNAQFAALLSTMMNSSIRSSARDELKSSSQAQKNEYMKKNSQITRAKRARNSGKTEGVSGGSRGGGRDKGKGDKSILGETKSFFGKLLKGTGFGIAGLMGASLFSSDGREHGKNLLGDVASTLTNTLTGWWKTVSTWFKKINWKEDVFWPIADTWNYTIAPALEETWEKIKDMWSDYVTPWWKETIVPWWENTVVPWFDSTIGKWWRETVVPWWENTGVGKWWKNNVTPTIESIGKWIKGTDKDGKNILQQMGDFFTKVKKWWEDDFKKGWNLLWKDPEGFWSGLGKEASSLFSYLGDLLMATLRYATNKFMGKEDAGEIYEKEIEEAKEHQRERHEFHKKQVEASEKMKELEKEGKQGTYEYQAYKNLVDLKYYDYINLKKKAEKEVKRSVGLGDILKGLAVGIGGSLVASPVVGIAAGTAAALGSSELRYRKELKDQQEAQGKLDMINNTIVNPTDNYTAKNASAINAYEDSVERAAPYLTDKPLYSPSTFQPGQGMLSPEYLSNPYQPQLQPSPQSQLQPQPGQGILSPEYLPSSPQSSSSQPQKRWQDSGGKSSPSSGSGNNLQAFENAHYSEEAMENVNALYTDLVNSGWTEEAAKGFAVHTLHESGGIPKSELSYKNTSIAQIRVAMASRDDKFSNDELEKLKQNDEEFYEAMYGGDKNLGNTEKGDGYKYRGRGLLGHTGRAEYRRLTKLLKSEYGMDVDLEADPDRVNDRDIAIKLAALYAKSADKRYKGKVSKETNQEKAVENAVLLTYAGSLNKEKMNDQTQANVEKYVAQDMAMLEGKAGGSMGNGFTGGGTGAGSHSELQRELDRLEEEEDSLEGDAKEENRKKQSEIRARMHRQEEIAVKKKRLAEKKEQLVTAQSAQKEAEKTLNDMSFQYAQKTIAGTATPEDAAALDKQAELVKALKENTDSIYADIETIEENIKSLESNTDVQKDIFGLTAQQLKEKAEGVSKFLGGILGERYTKAHDAAKERIQNGWTDDEGNYHPGSNQWRDFADANPDSKWGADYKEVAKWNKENGYYDEATGKWKNLGGIEYEEQLRAKKKEEKEKEKAEGSYANLVASKTKTLLGAQYMQTIDSPVTPEAVGATAALEKGLIPKVIGPVAQIPRQPNNPTKDLIDRMDKQTQNIMSSRVSSSSQTTINNSVYNQTTVG